VSEKVFKGKPVEKVEGNFFLLNGIAFDFEPTAIGSIVFTFQGPDGRVQYLVVVPRPEGLHFSYG